MILSDIEIRKQIQKGNLLVADDGSKLLSPDVGNIAYDLTTKGFYSQELGGEGAQQFILQPLGSVFVASSEKINLPKNISAEIKLKYGLMTDGLMLDAPLYQPGHKNSNMFFRLTNISNREIKLTVGKKYAYVIFSKTHSVEKPYNGKFCDSKTSISEILEHSYESIYPDVMNDINKTRDTVNNAEKTIYGNVLVIITIFITLFSLLFSIFNTGDKSIQLSTIFLILGSIFALVGAVCIVIGNSKSYIVKAIALCIISALFFILSHRSVPLSQGPASSTNGAISSESIEPDMQGQSPSPSLP